MVNPFTLGIVTGDDFCDRTEEKKKLLTYIRNNHNVVLYAKRLIGKSSLVKQVLKEASRDGIMVVYANIFRISSEKDFIERVATAIASGIDHKAVDLRSVGEKFLDLFRRIKIGIETSPQGVDFTVGFDKTLEFSLLLDDLMRGLYNYVEKNKTRAVIALDEFQEITELPESKKVEGTLRQYMQERRDISYIYVGSRRRVLLDMFTDKKRPFYKSAFAYSLKEIPRHDFAAYISDKFKRSKKSCPREIAEEIYDTVSGYSYYVQKLASLCWDITEKHCDREIVRTAYNALIEIEAPSDFEGLFGGLPLGQKALLMALAKEPTVSLFSKDYLNAHSLSQGTIQRAIKALVKRDLVEKSDAGVYQTTDPVFGAWLRSRRQE